MITQETRDKEEGMLVQHPGTPPQNSVSEDNLSTLILHPTTLTKQIKEMIQTKVWSSRT